MMMMTKLPRNTAILSDRLQNHSFGFVALASQFFVRFADGNQRALQFIPAVVLR